MRLVPSRFVVLPLLGGFFVSVAVAGLPAQSSDAHFQRPAGRKPGTWHGERSGVKFYPSGENIAYYKPSATVHPLLTEHSLKMEPGVYQVADRVYLA